MKSTFLSYRRYDGADDVTTLGKALRTRGLRIWRDLDDLRRGFPSEDEIRTAIKDEVGAVLCYVTPGFLSSDFVWQVEVPESLERRRRFGSNFPVIPFLACIDSEELRRKVPHGNILASLSGEVIARQLDGGRPVMIPEAFTRGVEQVLRSMLGLLKDQLKDQDRPLEMVMMTRVPEAPREADDLVFDWRDSFGDGRPAPTGEWSDLLLPSLRSSRNAITAIDGSRSIMLRGNAHQSAAIALGHTFSTRGGFQFRISQRLEGGESVTWESHGNASEHELNRTIENGNVAETDAILSISVSRDIRHEVDRWLEDYGRLVPRTYWEIRPRARRPERDFVRDEQHARAIARYIANEIRDLRRSVEKIHLFIAMPWSIAAFLGQQLDACGPIQVYEHDREGATYVSACALT